MAPLASFLDIPIVVTDAFNHKIAETFYPFVKTLFMPDLEKNLFSLVKDYDIFLECKYWRAHLKFLSEHFFRKKVKLVFCPHGQSDKGYDFPLLSPYREQDAVLLYGDLLFEMLQELKIEIPPYHITGNYRLAFYRKHQKFYDSLLPFDFPKKQRTLLYAPTWQDSEKNTSFFTLGKRVIEELPPDWNLIIKAHPLLKEHTPKLYYQTIQALEGKKNIHLLCDFPPVYPVLAKVDRYLGDASSVGYDFLTFEKPMFFFPGKREKRLFQAGTVLDLGKNLFSQMENPPDKTEEQKKLYRKAFFFSNTSSKAALK